jgi:hypothetical protein
MPPKTLIGVLDRVKTWPENDQETLVEYAREIEAQRKGVYVMSDEERAAVEIGLAQARRGEFATDEEMKALWKEFGL